MKLRCPECGAKIDFDQAEQAGVLAEVKEYAERFGTAYTLVSEYLDGFRSGPKGALADKKRLRLLTEVWQVWISCQFSFGGQVYQTSQRELRLALRQVANRQMTDLRNHNYLKQVLRGLRPPRGAQVPTGETPVPQKYADRPGRQTIEVPDE